VVIEATTAEKALAVLPIEASSGVFTNIQLAATPRWDGRRANGVPRVLHVRGGPRRGTQPAALQFFCSSSKPAKRSPPHKKCG
jgi:hypothetical protein